MNDKSFKWNNDFHWFILERHPSKSSILPEMDKFNVPMSRTARFCRSVGNYLMSIRSTKLWTIYCKWLWRARGNKNHPTGLTNALSIDKLGQRREHLTFPIVILCFSFLIKSISLCILHFHYCQAYKPHGLRAEKFKLPNHNEGDYNSLTFKKKQLPCCESSWNIFLSPQKPIVSIISSVNLYHLFLDVRKFKIDSKNPFLVCICIWMRVWRKSCAQRIRNVGLCRSACFFCKQKQ